MIKPLLLFLTLHVMLGKDSKCDSSAIGNQSADGKKICSFINETGDVIQDAKPEWIKLPPCNKKVAARAEKFHGLTCTLWGWVKLSDQTMLTKWTEQTSENSTQPDYSFSCNPGYVKAFEVISKTWSCKPMNDDAEERGFNCAFAVLAWIASEDQGAMPSKSCMALIYRLTAKVEKN